MEARPQSNYPSPKVVIAGAGLAGLALAQALRRSDYDFVLYEKDPAIDSRPQGYRIHISPEGSRALSRCLPEELFALFDATSGAPASQGPAFLNARLEDRSREIRLFPAMAPGPPSPEHPHRGLDRLVLRNVLRSGLESHIRYGSSIVGVEESASGRLLVSLSSGATEAADLVVGADGVGSRVRELIYPDALVTDSGWRGIFGKTYLSPANAEVLEPFLDRSFTIVSGERRTSVFAAGMRVRSGARETAQAHSLLTTEIERGDYVMWVVVLPPDADPVDSALVQAQEAVRCWHPNVEALVRQGEPTTVATLSFRETSLLGERGGPQRITLLGDSLHAMVPAGGEGGSNAFQDAAELGSLLACARRGEMPLEEAVRRYEASAIPRGFAAIERSHQLAESLFGVA